MLEGLTFGIFFLKTQSFGNSTDNFPVAHGLAAGLNGFLFQINAVVLDRPVVGADIIFLELGIGGQDNIGKDGIIFHPGMLDQDKFNFFHLHGMMEGVGIIPAGAEARSIRPEHMDFVLARQQDRHNA